MISEKFKCDFCKKEFARERTLDSHLCEKKRRWINRDSKEIRIALASWQHWCRKTGMYATNKTMDYRDFMDTTVYTTFVRFGSFRNCFWGCV